MRGAILLLPSYAFTATVKYNEVAAGTSRSHCTRRYGREHTDRLQEHSADAVPGASGGRTDGTIFEQLREDWPCCYREAGGRKVIRIGGFRWSSVIQRKFTRIRLQPISKQ